VGYYMRYIVADDRPVTLEDVRTALGEAGGPYEVDGEETEATISYGGHRVGHLTLNTPGDGLFDAERDELVVFADDGEGRGKERVLETLRTARGIVAVQVLFGDGNSERTLAAIDPIWRWLHANRRGLLQADDEGYYDRHGLILTV
jgi:hypothetical protein